LAHSLPRNGSAASKIEVVIMRRRHEAGYPVREKRPKRGPGFDAGIPGFRQGMLVPGNLSEIVDGGKMRRCRNVGEAHLVTGQPAPMVGQEADVAQMVAQVGASGPQNGEVRPRDLARSA